MRKRVFGELSIEDYQRVLAARERKKNRIVSNGTDGERPDSARKPRLWERVKNMRRPVLGLLFLPVFYSAGATWRWDGKWSREMDMGQLATIAEDSTYPDDRAAVVAARIGRKIAEGMDALAALGQRGGLPRAHAMAELQQASDDALRLLSSLR